MTVAEKLEIAVKALQEISTYPLCLDDCTFDMARVLAIADEALGLIKPEFLPLFAGYPGHGKSTLAALRELVE